MGYFPASLALKHTENPDKMRPVSILSRIIFRRLQKPRPHGSSFSGV
jgi:hypothetical protein